MKIDQKIKKINKISEKLNNILKECDLCPRNCKVNRYIKTGYCHSKNKVFVASHNSHNGEEPPISGENGSGTIFFSNCSLKCIFCQNWPISMKGNGKEVTIEELSEMMLELQKRKCHNINLVTPTHYYPQIIDAYKIALEKGLNIPLISNCSGYESLEVIKMLNGIIDIYLVDAKYSLEKTAKEFSNAFNYPKINQIIIKKMYEQVGNIILENELAKKGLWIRHMVLPGEVENSKKVLEFIASIDKNIYISIMSQYFPAYNAVNNSKINRPVEIEEYYSVTDYGIELGLKNMFIQEMI